MIAKLMEDLTVLGIRLEAHGDRLRYSPRSAATLDLIVRLKSNKASLLVMLRVDPQAPIEIIDDIRPEQFAAADEFDWVDDVRPEKESESHPRCFGHSRQRWWRSIYGQHLICGICHPPAIPEVLRDWVLDY